MGTDQEPSIHINSIFLKIIQTHRQRLPTDLETFFKLSFRVFYRKKNNFFKTKLVNPFQFIKLSPKEKREAAIVYRDRVSNFPNSSKT